jgi:hypothetical protein
VSRQANVNIVALVIAAVAFVVLGIAYSRGGQIMIYVLPFILALCALGLWNRRQWKAEKKAKVQAGPQ